MQVSAPDSLREAPLSAIAPGDTTVAVLDPQAAQAATVERPPEGVERAMLAEDKLPVVLAVVLVIWLGVLLLLFRTERRLAKIERALERE